MVKQLVTEMAEADKTLNANSDNPRQSSGSEQPRNVQGIGDVLSQLLPLHFQLQG